MIHMVLSVNQWLYAGMIVCIVILHSVMICVPVNYAILLLLQISHCPQIGSEP